MLRSVLEAGVGFVAACLVAGLALVLFVVTPTEVVSLPADQVADRIGGILELAGLVATQAALFSAPLMLAVGLLGEIRRIRTWSFYGGAGVAIAAIGFAAQQAGERLGEPSLVNTYAAVAFLSCGFAGGLAYWAVRGRRAGRHPPPPAARASAPSGG